MIDTKNLDAAAKFHRVMASACCDFSGPMKSSKQRENLAHFLSLDCPAVDASGVVKQQSLPEGYELARQILGADFIDPTQVAKAYGWSYTDEQLENLKATLPSLETLVWYRSNGYAFVATSPSAMNLLEVRGQDSLIFFSKEGGWYAEEKQKFARDEKLASASWLAIRKDAVPDSLNENWEEQNKHIQSVERVPTAVEVAYMYSLYRKVLDVRLLDKVYVRTSSVSAFGLRVCLGVSGAGGLDVYDYWDDDRYSNLGLSSARK